MKCRLLFVFFLLFGCEEVVKEVPPPISMTAEALGHYCQMNIQDHSGPKGQIHLAGYPMPIWFSPVRDALAYIKQEERVTDVTAFYINDMGTAESWEKAGTGAWILATDAFFVVGSNAIGGMGAPELVPFAVREDAVTFAGREGGRVKRLSEIDPSDVLAPVSLSQLPVAAK